MRKLCCFIATLVLLASCESYAFRVEPMEVAVSPKVQQPNPFEEIRIENTSNERTRVKIELWSRTTGSDGQERRERTKDFRADPSETLIPAGGVQQVRLTYQGSVPITQEKAYRVVVTQVDSPKSDASKVESANGVRVRLRYEVSLYASMPSEHAEAADLQIKSIRQISNSEFRVEIVNRGRTHQLLRNFIPVLTVGTAAGTKVISLTPSSRQIWGKENLLAGTRRVLILETDAGEIFDRKNKLTLKLEPVPKH